MGGRPNPSLSIARVKHVATLARAPVQECMLTGVDCVPPDAVRWLTPSRDASKGSDVGPSGPLRNLRQEAVGKASLFSSDR